jgi:TonB family protein
MLVPVAAARGQDATVRQDSTSRSGRADSLARCDSVLRAGRADSIRVSVRGELVRTDGGILPRTVRELVAQELLLRLTLPRPLVVPVFAPGPTRMRMLRPDRGVAGDTAARLREPAIHGVYHFRLLRTGKADSVSVVIPSLSPGLDSSIVDALRRASDERTLPMFPEGLDDTLRMQLRVTSAAEETRLRAVSVVLFQSMFPRHLVTDAVPWERNPTAPYPDEERDSGQDGDVLLRAVIDVDGTPVVPTLEVSHATSRAFALSALRTIARWRFTPARVGACPVLQVVHVPFWFSVRP